MVARRFLLISRFALGVGLLLVSVSCTRSTSNPSEAQSKLTIGIVTYDEGARSVDQYTGFTDYLGSQTKTLIELEPAYNEIKALEQIERQAWGLVFAPPGLAAIAISKSRYRPILPLQGIDHLSSVLVVRKDSPVQNLQDLNGKSVALGQPGSATGYYVPLYNLYGLTLAEVRLAPTPKTVLEWISKGEVDAGALSKDALTRHQAEFRSTQFRILLSSRRIPSGAVLVSPQMDLQQQEIIKQALNQAIPQVVQQVGYIINTPPPDYKTLIAFINKVKPIESNIREKPALLYADQAPVIE